MRYIIFLIILLSCSFSIVANENINKPFFSISIIKKQQLVNKAKKIRIGDSYKTVLSKLGKPNSDRIVMKKQNNDVLGRTLTYNVVIWEENLVNEKHDQYVSIFFSKSDNVKNINIKVYVN